MPLGTESYLLACPQCSAQGPDNFREEQRYSVRVVGGEQITLPGRKVLVCAVCGWILGQEPSSRRPEAGTRRRTGAEKS